MKFLGELFGVIKLSFYICNWKYNVELSNKLRMVT